MTEGLSARFPICCIEIRLSYPLRHFVTPPLTIRGGRGRGQKRKSDKAFNLTGLPVPCESGYVKTRRYRQDAKDKAFRRGAYSYVRDPRKTQSDNVLRCIYAFRSNQPKKVTVKTRRYKQDAKGADFAQGAYLDVSDQAKTQGRQCIAKQICVSPE